MTDMIDLSRIRETSDGDYEFEIELIEMYLDDAAQHVAKIEKHIANNDASGLKISAHTLKGSSANIGATGVQDASTHLEVSGKTGDMSQCAPMLTKLQAAFAQTDKEFREYVASIS